MLFGCSRCVVGVVLLIESAREGIADFMLKHWHSQHKQLAFGKDSFSTLVFALDCLLTQVGCTYNAASLCLMAHHVLLSALACKLLERTAPQ